MPKRAFAVAAHPDDIEFQMAGTLILLRRAGYETHYWTIANGSCGTAELGRGEIIALRRREAMAAASSLSAVYHESLVDDIALFYEPALLARVGAVMREVAPEILLVQSPQDYMEDHQNAARLAVTAAFTRGMPNYTTDPPRPTVPQDVTVYHAQPHANCGPLRELVRPDLFVDISGVLAEKREALALHSSQKAWLDRTQGMDAYLNEMVRYSRDVGAQSSVYTYAEGWRRRLHLGLCAADADPLREALTGTCAVTLRETGDTDG